MALNAVEENLDNVPEALHDEYVEMDDGRYLLDVTDVGSYMLVDVSGLVSALKKERRNVKQLRKVLKGISNIAMEGIKQ